MAPGRDSFRCLRASQCLEQASGCRSSSSTLGSCKPDGHHASGPARTSLHTLYTFLPVLSYLDGALLRASAQSSPTLPMGFLHLFPVGPRFSSLPRPLHLAEFSLLLSVCGFFRVLPQRPTVLNLYGFPTWQCSCWFLAWQLHQRGCAHLTQIHPDLPRAW